MTRRRVRRALVALAGTALLFETGFASLTPVGAAEGQLIQIGGNGPDTCEFQQSELGKDPPFPTNGIISTSFRRSNGMRALASDVYGNRYLALRNVILDNDSVIAGVRTGEGTQADGAPGNQTTFLGEGILAMTAEPFGQSLYVGLAPWNKTVLDSPKVTVMPSVIRRVDLLDGKYSVTTLTELPADPTALAADRRGNIYVADVGGAVRRLNASGGLTTIGSVPQPRGLAVDVTGTEIYVSSDNGNVYRVNGASNEVIAGGTVPHSDGGSPSMVPRGVAIGHETDGQQSLTARYLYIADESQGKGRVVRVDLTTTPRVITTVAGGGPTFVKSAQDAKTAALQPRYLAADFAGHVYIAASEQCAIFQLETPSPFRVNTAVTNPPAATNTTLPSGGSRTGDNESTAPDPAPAGNGNTQVEPGTGGQPASQGNQTQIVPGSQTQVQAQPQTELRVIDQGNVVTAPQQTAQPTVEPVPTPSGAAQFTPTPVQAPAPAPTPTPADVSTAVAPDPGPTSAAITDAAPAVPAAPAVAPVPPAPASAPPPAAQQPVANPGLVHGDSGSAPTRGATRYAMVRNDDEQPIAALAMAGAGAIVAVFICVMFVAPGASSKPKPRPKGAY